MKKFLSSTLLAVLLTVLLTSSVLAASYTATVTVTESGSNNYTPLSVSATVDNTYLVDNSFITSSGLDTRVVEGGTELPHMVASDRTLFAANINANAQHLFSYTTGNALLSPAIFPIITGYDGYVTIPSDISDDMQPGNDFEIEQKGWVDTDADSDKNLVYKENAFRTYIDGASNITSAIIGYSTVYPSVAATNGGTSALDTSHTVNLPGGIVSGNLLLVAFDTYGNPTITFPNEGTDWIQLYEVQGDGGYVTSGIWYRIADGGEGATITVTTSVAKVGAHTSYRIINYSGVPEVGTATKGTSTTPDPPSLTPSWGAESTLWFAACGYAYSSGPYTVSNYPGSYTDGRNDYVNAASHCGVGTARRELTAISEDPGTFTLSDANCRWVANTVAIAPEFGIERANVTVTGIDSGELIVKTTAAANVMTLSVTNYAGTHQGNSPQDVDITGVSVPDNANDWKLNQNNVMPYMEYYKHTVGGVLHAWYEPNTIVDATDYDGTADAGSSDVKIIDAELIQADDYWNDALLTITSAGGAAPEGETAIITDFKDATNELDFAALTAAVEAGDTYTVDFATLTDRSYYGLDFAGADYITVADDPSFDITTNLTAMVWVSVDDITDAGAILLSKHRAILGGREWTLQKKNIDGAITVNLGDPADGSHETTLNTDNEYLVNNTWALVGFTFDNGTVLIYYNGVSVPFSGVAPPVTLYNGAQPVQLGASPIPDSFLIGKEDEALIFSTTLTPGQMEEAFNAGLGNYTPPTTAGLVMHLHMEDGSGATATDTSGEGNDGTITNATWVNGKVPRPAGNSGTNDSVITWGANPAGVVATIGALLPETQSAAVVEAGEGTPEFAPTTEGLEPMTSTGVEGEGFPLYGMFKGLLGEWHALGGPDISMPYFWKSAAVILGWVFGTAVMLTTRNIFFGVVAYFIGFAVPAGAMGGVLDLWVPMVYGIGALSTSLLVAKWGSSSL